MLLARRYAIGQSGIRKRSLYDADLLLRVRHFYLQQQLVPAGIKLRGKRVRRSGAVLQITSGLLEPVRILEERRVVEIRKIVTFSFCTKRFG